MFQAISLKWSDMTKNQHALLAKIKQLGRLLNEEEIIDFYIENCSRGTCHSIVAVGGIRTIEDRLWQIKAKAQSCYTYTLGRLVVSGAFVIKNGEENVT